MEDADQALAYAHADFSEPHDMFVALLRDRLDVPTEAADLLVDLGCGPGDVTMRFARAFPRTRIDGVDGSRAMLDLGVAAVARARLDERVRLCLARLPDDPLPEPRYDGVISNAMLHHLSDPTVLWQAVKRAAVPGAWVFVMDLRRPATLADARRLVETYAAEEAEVLKRDFYNSLLAAYRPEEVQEQLQLCGLASLVVEAVGDRHLIVHGRLEPGSQAS